MKINELVDLYKEDPNKLTPELLEVVEYIPYMKKKIMCASLCNEILTVENDYITYDAYDKDVLFMLLNIIEHTNLESTGSDIDDYDLLMSNHLIEKLLDMFEVDYAECVVMLNAMLTERCEKNNAIEVVVSKQIDKHFSSITNTLDKFLDKGNPETMAKYVGGGFDSLAKVLSNSNLLTTMVEKLDNITNFAKSTKSTKSKTARKKLVKTEDITEVK